MGVSAALVRALGISFLKLVLGGGVRQMGVSSICAKAAWAARVRKKNIFPTQTFAECLRVLVVIRYRFKMDQLLVSSSSASASL
jgi:hypothetical protein